jgi:hypothetical protein
MPAAPPVTIAVLPSKRPAAYGTLIVFCHKPFVADINEIISVSEVIGYRSSKVKAVEIKAVRQVAGCQQEMHLFGYIATKIFAQKSHCCDYETLS